ncbi:MULTISPECIES: hypothetical protein [unclassified Mesorhizobium]|uniref:hypothetical protein n=1 Tax=unclassified Mesorhizobium TaxID=325217 RepID=UPI003015623A
MVTDVSNVQEGGMRRDILTKLVVASAFGLLVLFDVVTNVSSVALTTTWLFLALSVLIYATGQLAWTLLGAFIQEGGRSDLDTPFWITFLALPFCFTLLYVVIWNLIELHGSNL